MIAPTNRTDSFVVVRGSIPAELSNGKIYINPQGSRAHHLCACGCGSRVLTPLNDWEWSLAGTDAKPSLDPSIGNWNFNCQSHYWIDQGRVIWARRWTADEIAAGRAKEQRPYLVSSRRDKIGEWLSRLALTISRLWK